MAVITKPYTFSAGATIVAAEHNDNFNTIYNDYNGNITNANIASNAAIVDTKLAQITTASKISGAAITLISSLPSGAGLIPVNNLGNTPQKAIGNFTRVTSVVSGTQAITGTGFQPKVVILIHTTNVSGPGMSIGFDDATNRGCIYHLGAVAADNWLSDSAFAMYSRATSGANFYTGIIQSMDSDGFTMSWTKTGSPTHTMNNFYLALG